MSHADKLTIRALLLNSTSICSARIWFFLFLSDHQISFGAGRPPMLSYHYVLDCRRFLELPSPLSIRSDARLISTLELLIVRERYHDVLAPYEAAITESQANGMRMIREELSQWHSFWSRELIQRGYSSDSFLLHSLRLQRATADLYFMCTALRGIKEPKDMHHAPRPQAKMIKEATGAALEILDIANGSASYRENLAHAPSYTYITTTFAAVFLIKVARLTDDGSINTAHIFQESERLASRLAEVAGANKYAHLIRMLLQAAWRDIAMRNPSEGLQAIFGNERLPPAGSITPARLHGNGANAGLANEESLSLLHRLLADHQRQEGEDHQRQEASRSSTRRPSLVWPPMEGGMEDDPGLGDAILPGWMMQETVQDVSAIWDAFLPDATTLLPSMDAIRHDLGPTSTADLPGLNDYRPGSSAGLVGLGGGAVGGGGMPVVVPALNQGLHAYPPSSSGPGGLQSIIQGMHGSP